MNKTRANVSPQPKNPPVPILIYIRIAPSPTPTPAGSLVEVIFEVWERARSP